MQSEAISPTMLDVCANLATERSLKGMRNSVASPSTASSIAGLTTTMIPAN